MMIVKIRYFTQIVSLPDDMRVKKDIVTDKNRTSFNLKNVTSDKSIIYNDL